MAKSTKTTDSNVDRARWGGSLLAIGAVLAIVSTALYLSLPALTGVDGAARAAQIAGNPDQVRWTGYTGLFANAFLALGAFFLVTRDNANPRGIPSAFWLAVGVGALISVGTLGFFGTGYLALAQNYAANAAIFQASLLTTSAFAGLSAMTLGVGAVGVFWAEASADKRAIPAAASYLAVLGGLGAVVAGIGFLTGLTTLLVAYFGVFLLQLVLVYFGAVVAYPSLASQATPASRTTKA